MSITQCPFVEQASLFSETSNSKDVDFGSFLRQDYLSATFNDQNGSAEVNAVVPESSVSDRVEKIPDLLAEQVIASEGESAEVRLTKSFNHTGLETVLVDLLRGG
ncbi:hypothetical protein GH714_018064 [Hevea brasiliensis]|uniref:Uncharacterized protein n=1 Tax=Hevea brasiliensis TaxID=3981 RepID=A0A6A6KUC9_HEVBR|nr:hypothetical protein GH714_018064 [Hevea brasiliensis]